VKSVSSPLRAGSGRNSLLHFPNAAISVSQAVNQCSARPRVSPGFTRPATISRPVERRIGISVKAVAAEIELEVIAGRGVLCARRFFDEYVPM
jgi:hypothetical protein